MRTYQHPLTGRYASTEMSYLFSPHKKFSTWRRLWLALAEAHRRGVLHRDVKPANVMLRRDGAALLGDFGLARDGSDPGERTGFGVSG